MISVTRLSQCSLQAKPSPHRRRAWHSRSLSSGGASLGLMRTGHTVPASCPTCTAIQLASHLRGKYTWYRVKRTVGRKTYRRMSWTSSLPVSAQPSIPPRSSTLQYFSANTVFRLTICNLSCCHWKYTAMGWSTYWPPRCWPRAIRRSLPAWFDLWCNLCQVCPSFQRLYSSSRHWVRCSLQVNQ